MPTILFIVFTFILIQYYCICHILHGTIQTDCLYIAKPLSWTIYPQQKENANEDVYDCVSKLDVVYRVAGLMSKSGRAQFTDRLVLATRAEGGEH